ncbi:MAG: hypothetical protein K6F34_04995 [Lachnospiraceae bacterium]|nr:hypothetical protein [Lachnospiraceae bacterium]
MDSQNMYDPNTNTIYVPQADEMSVGDWIITLLLTCIPIVNIILLILWAVGSSNDKPARKNWAIAQLIFIGIAFILSMVFGAAFAALIASLVK